jgi:outer membrane immunogenic protein
MTMRTGLFAAAIAAALTASSAAYAADMPAKTYAPVTPMPVMSWTGFYAGLNVGYGWADVGISGSSNNLTGVLGGGQVGYNWQSGAIVFGLEADIQASGQKRSDTVGIFTIDQKLPWFATLRGRIGYAPGPWLFYATGGAAWVNYKLSVSALGTTISDDATKTAWTVGLGAEWMFMPRWSAKLEYLYMDTGDTSVTLFGTTFTGRAKDNLVRVGVNYHF